MIEFSLIYDGDGMSSFLDMAYRLFDVRPLASRIAMIAREQNLLERDVGRDLNSVDFTPLAPSTMKRRIRQGRLGPPLAPDGPASDIIGFFQAEEIVHHPDDVTVLCGWPGLPWVGYHVTGNARLPQRNPAGLAPHAQEQVVAEFEEFVAGLLAMAY